MVIEIDRGDDGLWRGRFTAMACPCEILIDSASEKAARDLVEIGAAEALRVERTFSRYRNDNSIHAINTANGRPVEVDDELAALLAYADSCYRLSDGLFDITSGILRHAWSFAENSGLPTPSEIARLRGQIGWDKVDWQPPTIKLPAGMEIDLGGLGKEYAVDRTLRRLDRDTPVLINFGGDLAANRPRADGTPWAVALEHPATLTAAPVNIRLSGGGIATSGDTRRSITMFGRRYSHILNPKTGWPVEHAPRSVTVVADSCMEAGVFATLAMLHGEQAEAFLEEQDLEYWIFR